MSWTTVKELLSIVGDICLFVIAVYTFYLTILAKKLKFIGFRVCGAAFAGDSLEVTLENRALSPISLKSVQIVYKSKYLISVYSEHDDGECIIDGFHTATLKMDPYSTIMFEDENENDFDLLQAKDIYLMMETSRGTQYISFIHAPKKRFLKYRSTHNPNLKIATISRQYYNEKIVKPDIRYALVFNDGENLLHTVLISKNGVMDEAVFGYNGLPQELATDPKQLHDHFEQEFKKVNLPFLIHEFSKNAESRSQMQ